MAKPKPPKIPRLVNLTFRVPTGLVALLKEVAAQHGKRPSEVARTLLDEGLSEAKDGTR